MRTIRWQFVAEPFYRPPLHLNPGSPLIEWFGAGKCSHVDTILPADLGSIGPECWLYGARSDKLSARACQKLIPVTDLLLGHSQLKAQANTYGIPAGVEARPPGYAVFNYVCIATIPVTDEQWHLFWRAEREKLGKPYDTTAIWGFAAGRDWRGADSWFCSEKQMDSAERAGIVRPLPGPISKVPPPAAMSIIGQAPGVTFEVLA